MNFKFEAYEPDKNNAITVGYFIDLIIKLYINIFVN